MKYGILLWPHANGRYREAIKPLSRSELILLLGANHKTIAPFYEEISGAEFLCFECDLLDETEIASVSRHSLAYLFCEIREGGLLFPLCSREAPYLFEDLSGVLKYKGKTNEAFTRCLMNFALCSGHFASSPKISLFDPMCGRGTTLFEAINRGFDATGSDFDFSELDEGYRFFKRYLEYHRIKHEAKDVSMTLPMRKSARVRGLCFAKDTRDYRAGDTRAIRFVYQEAALAALALGQNAFHAAVFDLPYGVQHAPGGRDSFEVLLEKTLPALARSIKPGGTVAFSFNTYTLKLSTARSLLQNAGFDACAGGPYEDNAHFVEQAIVRDIAVGVKK